MENYAISYLYTLNTIIVKLSYYEIIKRKFVFEDCFNNYYRTFIANSHLNDQEPGT